MRTYCRNRKVTRQDVVNAVSSWSRNESGRKNFWRIGKEYGSVDALVDEILSEIDGRSLSFRPIRRYETIEPPGNKVRIIGVESVKQQVVGYLAVNMLSEMIDRRVGRFQMSSIKGRGQLKAAKTIRRWVRSGNARYWVHLDIRKCYPSFDRGKIMDMLRRHAGSDDVLYVVESLLSTYGGGLNIGSYFSLKCCQLMLSFAYHFVESQHYVRRGRKRWKITNQLWYADDIYFLGTNKSQMRSLIADLSSYLRDMFGLELKPWKICKMGDDEPIDIAGFVVRKNSVTIRKTIFFRIMRAVRKFRRSLSTRLARSVTSYYGWICHTSSSKIRQRHSISYIMYLAKHMASIGAAS